MAKQKRRQAKKPAAKTPVNQFAKNPDYMGPMTVRQLVELVSTAEFPKGLDTRICIGDVEGNLGVNHMIQVTAHKPGDVVLSIDENEGDMGYADSLLPEEGAYELR